MESNFEKPEHGRNHSPRITRMLRMSIRTPAESIRAIRVIRGQTYGAFLGAQHQDSTAEVRVVHVVRALISGGREARRRSFIFPISGFAFGQKTCSREHYE
jgi:hypothetical protein